MPLPMPRPTKHPKTGIYYLRKGVPASLREIVGKSELKESLHTKDCREAKQRAVAVQHRFDRILERARRGQSPFDSRDVDSLRLEQRNRRADALKNIALRDGWTPDDFDGYALGLQEVVEGERAFEPGDPRAAAAEWGRAALRQLAAEHEITVPGDWQEAAAAAIYKAERRALADARAAIIGDETAPPKPNVGRPVAAHSLSALFEEYADGKQIAAKTREDWGRCIAHFEAWLDYKPARDISQAHLYRYADNLRAGGGPSDRPISTKRIKEGYIAAIRAACAWAVKRGKLPSNPADGFQMDATRDEMLAPERASHSQKDAAKILAACRLQTTDYKRWVPWLCAFTGARVKELMYVEKADIREEKGVPYLYISGKKSRAARRVVPLHPALIEEGFLEYADSVPDGDYLFPGDWSDRHQDRSKTPANRLREFIRKTLPDSEDTAPLHSFRHWLINRLRRAGVSGDVRRQLSGHADQDVHARYGREDVPGLLEALKRVESPLEPLGRSRR